MKETKASTIDAYIAGFPEEVQAVLQQIRATVKEAVPQAEEAIKYDMPTFVLNGNIAHFAAFKKHIGFYPAPTSDPAFAEELSAYKQGKGSIQFPLDKPIPLALITKIVKYNLKRAQQNTTEKE